MIFIDKKLKLNNQQQIPTWALWLFSILLTIILPLVYSSKTGDITLIPQFISFASILLLSVILFFIFGKQYSYSFFISPFNVVLFAYLLFSATSLIGSINIGEGVFELLKIGLWIILIVLLSNLFYNNSIQTILFKTITISSFIMSIIGLFQFLDIAFTSIPGNVVPYGTLGNRNIFIPSLLLTLPFVVHEIIITTSKKWKIFAFCSFVLNLLVLVVSEMRTAWAALCIAAFIISAILIFNAKKFNLKLDSKTVKILKILILAFVFIGIVGTIIFYNLSKEKNLTGSLLSMASSNERFVLWENSFEMFKEHPLNGAGVGNWKIMFPHYGLSELPREVQIAEMHYQRPENDFIWVLSETGILGFIGYVLVFVFAFSAAYKRMIFAKTITAKISMLIMIAALILYCVIAFFGFPKERSFLTIEFAIVLAIIFSEYSFAYEPGGKITIHSILVFLILIFCIYFGNRMYAGELCTRKIIDARIKNLHQQVILHSGRALQVDYTMDPTATPITFYRGVANFSLGKIVEAQKDFETARELHPNNMHVLNNLATCYESKREHERAIECLSEALVISPNFKDALVNLSAVYYNTGNIESANEFISKVNSDDKSIYYLKVRGLIDKKRNDSILFLAKCYYNSGNMLRAKETLLKCKRNSNNKELIKLKKLINQKVKKIGAKK